MPVIVRSAVFDADSIYRRTIVYAESADTTLYSGKPLPPGLIEWGKVLRRWLFVTQSGDVYVVADTTGAVAQRRGSIWGPR